MNVIRRIRRWLRPVEEVQLQEVVVEGERPWMRHRAADVQPQPGVAVPQPQPRVAVPQPQPRVVVPQLQPRVVVPQLQPQPGAAVPQQRRRRMSADRQVAAQVQLVLPPYPAQLLPAGVTRRGTRTRRAVTRFQAGGA